MHPPSSSALAFGKDTKPHKSSFVQSPIARKGRDIAANNVDAIVEVDAVDIVPCLEGAGANAIPESHLLSLVKA